MLNGINNDPPAKKTVLIVDDEEAIRSTVEEALEEYKDWISVLTAENGKQAIEHLNAAKVDLVLTDLKMPEMDGFELLAYISRYFNNLAVLVMTGFGSSAITTRLEHMGVPNYLNKPINLNTLVDRIRVGLEDSSKGYLNGFSLANFLQAVEVEQKTMSIMANSKGQVGYLHIVEGELINAETEDLKGEAAAVEIISWEDAEIKIVNLRSEDKKIDTPLMNILLEASRSEDERGQSTSSEDSLLNEAIQKAEAHHFSEAKELLARVVSENPRNHKGWLWYARVLGSMKAIETSLNNAAKVSPQNTEVIEEINKFNLAKRKIKNGSILRCPFCWFLLDAKIINCLSCGSFLTVSETFLACTKHADKAILKSAIERYQRVLESDSNNFSAQYNLGLAYINQEMWDEGVNHLSSAVNLSPENKFLSEQLNYLLKYIASGDPFVSKRKGNAADSKGGKTANKEKTVLVVEDSSTTRAVVKTTLGQMGYRVVEAVDGLEALSKLSAVKPDLILLDIILPKMDGYQILAAIKKKQALKDIPVIMLTAKDKMMDKVKGKLAGSNEYLTKPFDPNELLDIAVKYLQ
ncbi:MAG: response regulator [Deltaproteobacteria bacterium]|nr:response regulator [Deltaproteobacteria bacterium]MBW1845624.1 response regulator [Deltaproteobacteria bacterium]MBW2178830.1 response regulator [Deltaproteobacteria bacterium]MBW2363855.1 response regulator [Deltaproteobacteria bacterium]